MALLSSMHPIICLFYACSKLKHENEKFRKTQYWRTEKLPMAADQFWGKMVSRKATKWQEKCKNIKNKPYTIEAIPHSMQHDDTNRCAIIFRSSFDDACHRAVVLWS